MALLSLLPGCAREIRVHDYDKASLDALMPYKPVYTLDNNGRVIDLKLENKQLDDDAFDELAKLTALRAEPLWIVGDRPSTGEAHFDRTIKATWTGKNRDHRRRLGAPRRVAKLATSLDQPRRERL
ncbi:MAG TPA: hypothetical protein VF278_11925 [Pirellulales bacterium]